MGKITGFMDYTRKTSTDVPPLERIENFNEFHVWLSREEQQTQAARCMDCGVPFCQAGMMIGGMASGCPLNNLIPEWNDLVYQGKWELALHRLRATNRFPEFTSRVCPALCEAACTCGDVTGSSVTVRENEHAIVETGYAKGWLHAAPPPARTGKSVAVIGSGPAGLSVAEYLNIRGHAFPFRRQLKADRLPRVHPAVGKDRLSIRKKAAAPELDRTGKVGRNGTLAQKIAQKHSVLGLRRIGHRKKQPHMHPPPAQKT
mgnify:CR=1 FL=1